MIVNLTSPDNRYDSIFSAYATIYVKTNWAVCRVRGITYWASAIIACGLARPDKLAALT